MFRAHLRRLAVAGTLGPWVVAIGQWWTDTSDAEIDAVALAGRARTRLDGRVVRLVHHRFTMDRLKG